MNKAEIESSLKRKKKIVDAGGLAPSKSAEPTQRGNSAVRRIERQDLKQGEVFTFLLLMLSLFALLPLWVKET